MRSPDEAAKLAKRRRQDAIRAAAETVFGVLDELAAYRRNHLPSHREPIYHQALRQRFADGVLDLARAVVAATRSRRRAAP